MQQIPDTHDHRVLCKSLGKLIYRPSLSAKEMVKANYPQVFVTNGIITLLWLASLLLIVLYVGANPPWYGWLGLVLCAVIWLLACKLLASSVPQFYSARWDFIGEKGILSQRKNGQGKVLSQTMMLFDAQLSCRQLADTLEIRQGKQRLQFSKATSGKAYQAVMQAVQNFRPKSKGKRARIGR
ncbi:hypothetical protein HR45_18710 [Shewanella mangrovi]|uniref:Uncharacterized protein n=1 Tax=Shewanella mangrovi TaxID=1515746 RepID=A0A094LLM3_9GAMM|nr:hypothetical protein [Shewanella mangrovi]KFZ36038.1 hypothetical protein HR45_18710 [Shewanella mangrovi]